MLTKEMRAIPHAAGVYVYVSHNFNPLPNYQPNLTKKKKEQFQFYK